MLNYPYQLFPFTYIIRFYNRFDFLNLLAPYGQFYSPGLSVSQSKLKS